MPQRISAAAAREYWRALLSNAASLVEDAMLLMDRSPARARSLLILGREEIGKADRLYELSLHAWEGWSDHVDLTERFLKDERKHPPKLIASLMADDELDPFWGNYDDLPDYESIQDYPAYFEQRRKDQEKEAERTNLAKQAGFYVNRVGSQITAPVDVEVDRGEFLFEVQRTAGIAEMLLIRDHTRMQDKDPAQYDSTHDIQARFLPYTAPEAFLEMIEGSEHSDPPGDVDE